MQVRGLRIIGRSARPDLETSRAGPPGLEP